ncbi:hypothetical protein C8T65DRAFT_742676 [Cerioporus squamosus]|nr:hypothetical protein C8T65DRAFT_742674 [Cerioporus squamosus]KAI0699029.1 hypothetical protein C8T65DRAFT_742676 [Cerioporus squamosus]
MAATSQQDRMNVLAQAEPERRGGMPHCPARCVSGSRRCDSEVDSGVASANTRTRETSA